MWHEIIQYLAYLYKIDSYKNEVKLFNSPLKLINVLLKNYEQTNKDLTKLTAVNPKERSSSSVDSLGLLREIEMNNSLVRKE